MTIDELEQGHKRIFLEDMEKEIYVDKLTLNYSGYFSYKGFMDMVNSWVKENGYYREVLSSNEIVGEKGVNKSLGLQLQKKMSQIHLSLLNVDISFKEMTDDEKEVDGKMMNVNKGDVEVVFHGYLATSTKARWESKAYASFLRYVIDKFVYKLDKPKYRGTVVNDAKDLAGKMKGYLELYKGKIEE